jgi:adenosylmethionine-8-amino-7-oxononanoate aminotransferase
VGFAVVEPEVLQLPVLDAAVDLAPPLIIQKSEIDQLFGTVREVLKALA